MYTLALAMFIGFVAAQVTNFVVENLPVVGRIPVIGKDDNLFVAFTLLTVWLTDTSVLGAYGIGNGAQWVDVVGSGLAIVGLTNVLNTVASYIDRK
jgi:hypothetical protein